MSAATKVHLRSKFRALAVVLFLGVSLWGYVKLGRNYDTTGSPIAAVTAPPLDLVTDGGQRFNLASLQGDVVLVYFGYTHCPDVCPTTLASLSATLKELGPQQKEVRVIFVTLDPTHDQPALLRHYLKTFNPDFIGLTGSPSAVANAARRWQIAWRRVPGHPDYIDHSSVVTLIDPTGRERLRYGVSQIGHPQGIAKDIRGYLKSQ